MTSGFPAVYKSGGGRYGPCLKKGRLTERLLGEKKAKVYSGRFNKPFEEREEAIRIQAK
jgi:hypothetical protein